MDAAGNSSTIADELEVLLGKNIHLEKLPTDTLYKILGKYYRREGLNEKANKKIDLNDGEDFLVKLIKEAKQKKIDVTASVTPAHLFFSEEDLGTYDTHLKLNPPLRTVSDRKALQKGIADGSIDCIATHHIPYDADHKAVEFEYARHGMIGLQTAYAVLRTVLPAITQERWVELLAINPRKILGLPVPSIEKGAPASLTVFDPEHKWELQADAVLSQSKNSAFIGKPLTGKPLGIIHNNQIHLSL